MRLFFALQPTPAQNEALALGVAPLIVELGAQAVPARNFHATLCFVGALESERLDALRAIAAGVRGEIATLDFSALDYWEKPGILCAITADAGTGNGNGTGAADALASSLGVALLSAGFSPDIKPFRPHLTLARKVPAPASQRPWPVPLAQSVLVSCDRFALVSSRRDESGSIYSVVDSWALYGSVTV